jgi:hypothetical protein
MLGKGFFDSVVRMVGLGRFIFWLTVCVGYR